MIFDFMLDLLRGKAITIAPFDGIFRPNTLLDDAQQIARLEQADNLASKAGRLLASSGNGVYQITPGNSPVRVGSFSSAVSALAVADSGEVAVALESGELFIDAKPVALPAAVKCITALTFSSAGDLWLANGSAKHRPSEWATDLLEKGASGSLWRVQGDSRRCERLAGDIAFPYGLHVVSAGVVVSESWRHRLVLFNAENGTRQVLTDQLPGYPARIAASADGGAWLSLFAPRNRLVEFVLQETFYRREMMKHVPREFWIAPALASGKSFLEPLQCGGIKMMGVHKPWSPSRSYGLVVRLDQAMVPRMSLHSRADGVRHGVCSAIECGGQLLVAAKGGDCIVGIDVATEGAHQHE